MCVFEEAASVNIAAITALQALRDKGKVQPGQKFSSTARPAASARLQSRSRNRWVLM
jgi:NADPH:quinone reductase and related Zn-dependent oxidoreductases